MRWHPGSQANLPRSHSPQMLTMSHTRNRMGHNDLITKLHNLIWYKFKVPLKFVNVPLPNLLENDKLHKFCTQSFRYKIFMVTDTDVLLDKGLSIKLCCKPKCLCLHLCPHFFLHFFTTIHSGYLFTSLLC